MNESIEKIHVIYFIMMTMCWRKNASILLVFDRLVKFPSRKGGSLDSYTHRLSLESNIFPILPNHNNKNQLNNKTLIKNKILQLYKRC